MRDGFIEVSEKDYSAMINWYWENVGHYHWHPIMPADRICIFDSKECKLLVAYIDVYYEKTYYVNKEVFFGGLNDE